MRPDPRPPAVRSWRGDRELYNLTRLGGTEGSTALLAAESTEDGVRAGAVLACGSVLCEDLTIAAPPPGKIAAC